jgi:hypothetical protein
MLDFMMNEKINRNITAMKTVKNRRIPSRDSLMRFLMTMAFMARIIA